MNMTTKILILVNFFLAAAFVGVAASWYATGEHWKRRWDTDTRRLADQMKGYEQEVLTQSLARRNTELALEKKSQQNTALLAENEGLNSRIKTQESELSARDLRLSLLADNAQNLQTMLQAKEVSLSKVTQRNTELNHIAQVSRGVSFSLNVKLAELEDDLNNANAKISKGEEAVAKLTQEGKQQQAMLKLVEDRYPRVYNEINSESAGYDHVVQGQVAAVRTNPQGQQDLIMLTVGADDHVQEGMEFILYRGNQYLVKVRVRKVMPDMAACWVVPESWNAQGLKVEQGDTAQNRLF